MIVADTNLIAYALITGTGSEKARQVLIKDQSWSAPRLWRSEFMNILALYMRRRQFDFVVAVDLFQGAERLLECNSTTHSGDNLKNGQFDNGIGGQFAPE